MDKGTVNQLIAKWGTEEITGPSLSDELTNVEVTRGTFRRTIQHLFACGNLVGPRSLATLAQPLLGAFDELVGRWQFLIPWDGMNA